MFDDTVVDVTGFMAVSKICGRQNLSVKRVLSYLSDTGVIPEKGKRIPETFTCSKGLNIHTTDVSLRFEEENLMKYLDKSGALPIVAMVDERNELHDTIKDPKYRFERINEVVHGRIAFIDAEFKDGNYHEVAWEIREDGKVVDRKYFISRKEYMRKLRLINGKTEHSIRVLKLKEGKQDFQILARKHINRIMKKDMKSVDRIVAHNAYGERNMLINNGIYFQKSKFLCTSKMALGYIYDHDRMPSLIDLVEHYGISVNSTYLHHAHEDARVAAEVFYTMVNAAKKEFNIK